MTMHSARVAALTSFLWSVAVALAQPVLITAPANVGPSDLTIVDQPSGVAVPLATAQITIRGTTLTMAGRHTIASLIVERSGANPGVLTHPAAQVFDYSGGAGTDVVEGLFLNVNGNVFVQGTTGGVASRIDLNSRGFPAATGPGAGTSSPTGASGGAGAGHGGAGATSTTFAGGQQYGTELITTPRLGSGGGNYQASLGGAGGGAILINATGTVTIDGQVAATGATGVAAAGGGSGGSIGISAATFAGIGSLSVNSVHASSWGGASGGRISIVANENTFTGTLGAAGSNSTASGQRGAAGTILLVTNGQRDMVLDAGGNGTPPAALTTVSTTNLRSVVIRGGSNVFFTALNGLSTPLSVNGASRARFGALTALVGNVDVTGASRLEVPRVTTFPGSVSLSGGSVLVASVLLPVSVTQDLVLAGTGNAITWPAQSACHLDIGGNASIDAGSTINGNGLGFPAASGPGAGTSSTSGASGAAGAGHGGNGATSFALAGGLAYGSLGWPTTPGSGGGNYQASVGGAGGGAIRLNVAGTLTHNGAINCNGTAGLSAAGSGSGGSIWISAGSLAGSGSLSANGGTAGSSWGGGAGGRIAVHFYTSTFTGLITATGGNSTASDQRGGAGTIYLQPAFQGFPDVIIDAGGTGTPPAALTPVNNLLYANSLLVRAGSNVRLTDLAISLQPIVVSQASRTEFVMPLRLPTSLRAEGGSAIVLPSGDNILHGALELHGTASTLTWNGPDQLRLTAGTGAVIDATCSLIGTGRGFPAATGPGAGPSSTNGASGAAGAGHGGRGAAAGPQPGGLAYDSETNPNEPGSGGGNYQTSLGGSGGGAILFTVNGTLTLNGSIAMNGTQGAGAAGAGSGGSVFINADRLEGSGTITAGGGAGGGNSWGAGAGGRIAIYACDLTLPVSNITALRGFTNGLQAEPGTISFGSSGITITQQPPSLTVLSGFPLDFPVAAITAQPNGVVSYQWRKRNQAGEYIAIPEGFDGGRFTGTMTQVLHIEPTECRDAGLYDCLASDTCGSFPTRPATIVVDPVADYNDDFGIDGDDVIDFFADWDNGFSPADLNADGGVDGDDVIFFFARWDIGC